jgi:hypothetical protein
VGVITTRAELYAYLQQVAVNVVNDALMDDVLARATSIVEQAVEHEYSVGGSPQLTTVEVYSYGSPYLMIPVHSGAVTSVVGPDGVVVPSTYYTEQSNGTLYPVAGAGSPVWWSPSRPYPTYMWAAGRYLVTADFGPSAAPDAIVQVTLEVAVNIWRSRDKGSWTDVVGVDGSGGVRFVGGLTKSQQGIIETERRRLRPGIVV